MGQVVLVLDFGGQYKELIAQTVRSLGVYSEIRSGTISAEEIKALAPIGIILTGGPNSVYLQDSPCCAPEVFDLGIPVLGICYGMQMMSHVLGAVVETGDVGEYGRVDVTPTDVSSVLLGRTLAPFKALMSHKDHVAQVAEGFRVTARSAHCVAAVENSERQLYGVQFHPETKHSEGGRELLQRFLYDICGAKGDYKLDDYLEQQIAAIREQVGKSRVLLALSGGVDSSVCASLLSRAIPGQLTCIFVDHGFMRKDEAEQIEDIFSKRDLEFIRVNASERFLARLEGVSEPEQKRKIIGDAFIRVFEEESAKLSGIEFLAQGTIYPDVVESGGKAGATIKSHHNVGGLPEELSFKGLVEPLRGLFKDEVRRLGEALGLPSALVNRQPFPGPGLAIRVIGEVTHEKLETLREADAIFREEVEKLEDRPSQYFAVMTDTYSVGVKGDFRTYDPVLALRAVVTDDFMTAEYAALPHETLSTASARITSEVKHVSRVVYDITGKPPATVEWE